MFNVLEFHCDNEYQEKLNNHLMDSFSNNEEKVLEAYIEMDLVKEEVEKYSLRGLKMNSFENELSSNVLESQRTLISGECRLRFDDYLATRFPNVNFVSRPADDIYFELYSIRYDIAKQKVGRLYKWT